MTGHSYGPEHIALNFGDLGYPEEFEKDVIRYKRGGGYVYFDRGDFV